jgi:hypothetical protein
VSKPLMQPAPAWIRRGVQGIAAATIAVAVLAAVAGLLPGYRDYRDTNGCGEQAFDALFSFEHPHDKCTEHWVLERTRAAGGASVAAIMIGLAATAALVLWRPRLRWLVLWWLVVFLATAAIFVATFDIDFSFGKRSEELWPVQALTYLSGAAAILVFAIAPLFSLVGAVVPWLQRRRAARHV